MKKKHSLSKWLCKGTLLLFIQLFLSLSILGTPLYGQQNKIITVNLKNVTLLYALEYLTDIIGCEILYNHEQVKSTTKFDLDMKEKTLQEVLDKCLENTNLIYKLVDKVYVITSRTPEDDKKTKELTGVVVDVQGDSIPGVTVIIKGTTLGTSTDIKGMFKLNVPSNLKDLTLVFSFIGKQTQEIKANKTTHFRVILQEKKEDLEEVVVTGFSNIKKSSFTGDAIQLKKEDILKVSKRNILTALSTYDPSLRIIKDNEWGSNPNKVPEFYIRGRSAIGSHPLDKQALENNPNAPTFIMDGFEVTAQKVYDMDPERIETVTILKDAAATAMYGARAANGVIVITTVAPKPGEVRVDYSMVGNISIPDLSDYNLMNASEKLEAELRAGYYNDLSTQETYYKKLEDVARGVNTYWIGQPLRNSFSHKHSIYIQGGVEDIRFGVDVSYDKNNGVMKESFRNNISGGLTLDYRYKKLQVKNYISYTSNKSEESPYGSFAGYTTQLPYNEMKDSFGNYRKTLKWGDFNKMNPLYEATLGNYNKSSYDEIQDNLGVNWYILDGLQIKGTFAVNKQWSKNNNFIDPLSQKSQSSNDPYDLLRGKLVQTKGNYTSWDFSAMLIYNKQLGEHQINATLSYNVHSKKTNSERYEYRGFPSSDLVSPAYAKEIYENPSFVDNVTRAIGLLGSVNYDYNNIYALDFSYRLDGSSEFGDNKRWGSFYGGGVALNIHNYNFLKNNDFLTLLKVRSNYGQLGKADFAPYEASTIYRANLDNWYSSGYGVSIIALGNKDLVWQKTHSLDIGIDFELFNGLLYAKASWYNKQTVDLVSPITIPSSAGFTSYKENLGKMENKGYEIDVRSNFLNTKDIAASVFFNLSHNRNKLKKVSNALRAKNQQVNDLYDDYNKTPSAELQKPLPKYEEGKSTTAIWGMRSLGIDPSNGQDMLLNRDGSISYKYTAENQIVLGDREPEAEGNFGLNFRYKGFTLFTAFKYQFGGQEYNQTLVSKVENVNLQYYNADKRVLYDRWFKAGDHAKYKSIQDYSETTRPVSRFVQDNNWLELTSLTLGYDFQDHSWMRKARINVLRVELNMNDLIHISSIKQERGLSYPFAYSMGFTVRVGF